MSEPEQMAHTIREFLYDGLFIQIKPKLARYTGTFIKWTSDPGIVQMKCSDGETRLVPTCAINNWDGAKYPKQDTSEARAFAEKHGFHFGQPSHS